MKNKLRSLSIILLVAVLSISVLGQKRSKPAVGQKRPRVVIKPKKSKIAVARKRRSTLTEDQAIQKAEKFIADNGYTDLPPESDRRKISFQLWDASMTSDVNEILKRRRNTLKRKAYGISPLREGKSRGFYVVFEPVDPRVFSPEGLGQAVTVTDGGKKVGLEQKLFPLANVEKKLPN
ncbi:MAG TPA: hypothetical protein VJ302_10720 [Blastocatellia bacterium]|nr:hypothetical protein [Blastocatellia bacterium]